MQSAGAKVNGDMSAGRAVAGTESAGWVAPEVVDAVLLGRDAGFAIHPPAADMWALGCLLLLLATRHEPFAAGSLEQLHKEHRNWVRIAWNPTFCPPSICPATKCIVIQDCIELCEGKCLNHCGALHFTVRNLANI